MRKLTFEAIENARELGGLKTRDGRSVRRGALVRCGNLSRATDADVERLLRFRDDPSDESWMEGKGL